MKRGIFFAGLLLLLLAGALRAQQQPNIIFIYADDLGYGDLSCYGATRVHTPEIDRLATEGLRFTDGYATASMCTPSRFSVMTGQYAWRKKGTGIAPGNAGLIIPVETATLPSILQKAGYSTGAVGKWHLGLGGPDGPDWNGTIKPGPLELGFDYSYIIPATLDRVPTVFIDNHKVAGLDLKDPLIVSYDEPVGNEPTGKDHPELLRYPASHGHDQTIVNGIGRIGYMAGGKSARWVDEEVAQVLSRKAVDFIGQNKDRPFFLYYALTDIHVPHMPNLQFLNESGLGLRGDAILQMDWCVGRILHTLDSLGLTNNTLVIFSSDNGPVVDDGYADGSLERLDGHRPAGPLRGGKYSKFEGGTRVPFIIRWPGHVRRGTSGALVSQMDFPASFASFTHQQLEAGDAPDSFDEMDALLGKSTQGRKCLVEQGDGGLAIVRGKWKYIPPSGGPREYTSVHIEVGNDPDPQLYDLSEDIGETHNVANDHPEIVKELDALLTEEKARTLAAPDLRGPVLSDQFKVNTSGDGVSMTDFTYKPFPSSTLNGNGHWIWIDPDSYPDQQATETNWIGKRKEGSLYVVNFKKVINIGDDVTYANIKLSADVQYRVFINGRLSGRGPANTGSDYADHLAPKHWFYDEFDTRHSFKKGINVIAIEVSTLNKTASFTTMGRGGLIMEASIHLESGRIIPVSTDSSWVCEPSAAYRPDMVVDASKETAGWITSPVCDKTWRHAVVLPDSISSKWELRQSELPQMMEKRIFPVKITREGSNGDTETASYPLLLKASGTPQKIRLEFDNLYTGYLGFRVNGKAGTKLDLVTGEVAGGRAQEMKYILSEGVQTYESPHLMDGKYVDVTVTNPDGDLTIDDIVINYSSFPVSYLGDFSCSDPFLNALWKNVRWITQMNMQTYHMDSPLHQEPVSDAGDYLIESLVNYYAFSSPLLVKQDLRKIALILEKTGYKMFHTSYMLLWVQMLVHYYEYTGDKELLKELAPDVYKLLDQFHSYVGAPGIITNAPNYMFMDWGNIDGIEFHHPPASIGQGYMTAFYYKGLMEGKRIAGYLGDDRRSVRFAAEAETLKKAFVSNLYDQDRQLFKNGLSGSTTVKPNSWMARDTVIGLDLPYVNTLAVLYGLAPAGAQDSIIKYVLTQKKVTPSPYFMYFVFDAMAEAGDFNRYGMEQLRRWAMLSQHPVGLREGWAMGDYSHAWGGSPAYELSSKVLGVNPAKSGFKEVLIAPNPGDLDSASGVVPTPGGSVRVRWTHTSKDFVISVSNPVNMPVIFVLPRYKGLLTLNGKSIHGLTGSGKSTRALSGGPDTVMIRTGGGNNTIEMADSGNNTIEMADSRPGERTPMADTTYESFILTPKCGPAPHINGPKVYGCRPGSPFIYRVPATGDRPMLFSAKDLPGGLRLDKKTGIITGMIACPGTYTVSLQARNGKGLDSRVFKIVCGDKLALTPPMGWNDWYAHYDRITGKMMREAADCLVSSGMADAGYQYVDIDDCWMNAAKNNDAGRVGPPRDSAGNILPNIYFPDMKGLTDYIHSKGLKAGIYTSPGQTTCGGFTGSFGHEAQDAKQFADWGFDLLKYDYCSYGNLENQIKSLCPGITSKQLMQRPYLNMGAILKGQKRDISLNLCQYGRDEVWLWGAEAGNSWRTGGDLGGDLNHIFQVALKNAALGKWSGPGGWNDPDYIQIGYVGNANEEGLPELTRLTPAEQYSFMSLWCLLAAPLFYSGDLTRLNDFTLNVLCNPEVIDVDQDPLGQCARVMKQEGDIFIMVKDLEDGSKAVGLCNKGDVPSTVAIKWTDAGIPEAECKVRDLWRQRSLGIFQGGYSAIVPAHGVVLVKISSAHLK